MVIPTWALGHSDELYLTAMAVTVLLPAACSTWFRHRAFSCAEADQPQGWITWRRRLRLVTLFTVPTWWSLVTQTRDKFLLDLPAWFLLLVPLSVGALFAQVLAYRADRTFLGQRWTGTDIVRLAVWNTLSFATPLLALAVAIEALYKHRSFVGLLWMGCAAIASICGTLRLRLAEGLRPRQVKSGELYKRSLVLAKKMGVRLRRVSVVPFGRGRLTNAFGGPGGIAVTDDYGHWLRGAELDFVIGHELAHLKRKDPLTKLALGLVLFGSVGTVAFVLPHLTVAWRLALNFADIIAPLLAFYFVSRRCEYAADREAVILTGDAETGIRALTRLYGHVGAPVRTGWMGELFATHPPLSRRARAVARVGHLPAGQLGELLSGPGQSSAGDGRNSR